MSEFSFQTVPSLRFGEPAADALAPMVASFGARRLMLVTDPGVQGAGLVEPVVSALEASGLTVAVYDDVAADPPETKVLAAVEAARSFGAEAQGTRSLGYKDQLRWCGASRHAVPTVS